MLRNLFPSYLLIILVALIPVTWYATHSLRSLSERQTARDLETRARLVSPLIAGHIESINVPVIDSICIDLGSRTETRLTVILPDGRVLGDTEEDPAVMERHGSRPEIAEAVGGKVGTANRFSNTLQQRLLYVAVPIRDGDRVIGVVRASVPMTTLTEEVTGLTRSVILAGLFMAVLAVILSLVISRGISRPIEELRQGAERFARGELNYTLPVVHSDEIGGLAQAMNEMAVQLDDRIRTVIRQRNEQEAILASMVEGVIAVDSHEQIINLNRAAARLFRTKPEDAGGRSVHEVARNSELHRLVRQSLSSANPVEGAIELAYDGERQLQVHGTTLRDAAGQSIGAVLVLNDITRLRRLENVRSEFVANVSHELRTPVTSIKGFLETLRDGAIDSPEDARRFVDIMLRQANQLNNIIEDLLNLSRIEQGAGGGLELSRQTVAPSLRNVVQACATVAAGKDIRLVVEGDTALTAALNPTLFEQAVVNLLNNAVTYSPAGSVVTVGVSTADSGVDVYVADHGPGIEEHHLDRLFERFYRIDKARSRDLGGTGLGLAIVKHIAFAHGGRVSVKSTVGVGSTFTIHLPHPDATH